MGGKRRVKGGSNCFGVAEKITKQCIGCPCVERDEQPCPAQRR